MLREAGLPGVPEITWKAAGSKLLQVYREALKNKEAIGVCA